MSLKNSQKGHQIFRLLLSENYWQIISKIAQSGHTDPLSFSLSLSHTPHTFSLLQPSSHPRNTLLPLSQTQFSTVAT